MVKKLSIEVIGISEGNGHPYSWSSIFNGYNPEQMKDCGFPVIYEYLSERTFPNDGLGDLAEVTHIWTQNSNQSKKIAGASRIDNIVLQPEDMIGKVDAVLLARDDAENHKTMAMPFIKATLPIFIDKPFALNVKVVKDMWEAQQYPDQSFTCSSLRYPSELILTESDMGKLGNIVFAEGLVMKKWETYAIHIIEPIVSQLAERGKLVAVQKSKNKEISKVFV